MICLVCFFFFFKQKTAYEMRISDWSSDVCSSDLTYIEAAGRIETFLISRWDQEVNVAGHGFHFADGEAMQVEYSQKYTDASFDALEDEAGLRVEHRWNDPDNWFGLRTLRSEELRVGKEWFSTVNIRGAQVHSK